MKTLIILVVVLGALGALAALIALAVIMSWNKRFVAGGGHTLTPVLDVDARNFIDRNASFVVTADCDFDQSPDVIWKVLTDNGVFSWIPFVEGVRYADDFGAVGTRRILSTPILRIEEQIVGREESSRLTVTGTRVSIPLVLKTVAEEYRLTPTAAGGTRVSWTIAAQPKFGLGRPLSLAKPFVRPFAKAGLKGLGKRASYV